MFADAGEVYVCCTVTFDVLGGIMHIARQYLVGAIGGAIVTVVFGTAW